MPSILALDQGTTGSTALLVHQDGAVLGRGYREFTQHYPQPGWVEHDPEEILRVSVEAMREALAAAGERPVGIGITNQRETVVLWDRRTLAPVAPRSSGRTGAPASAAASCATPGSRRCSASEPGSSPIPISPRRSSSGCCVTRDCVAGPSGRARGRHRRELARRPAHRRAGARHRPHQRLAHAAVRARRARLGPRAAPQSSACRASSSDIVPSAGVVAETDRAISASSLPIAGLAGDQQAALFGQGCCAEGWPRTRTAPGPSCWSTPASACPRPAQACWRPRPAVPAASRPTRSRAACSSPARRCSGCATARADRGRLRARRSPGASATPAGSTSCRPSWGSARRTGRPRPAGRSPGSPAGRLGRTWCARRSRPWRSAAPSCSQAMAGTGGLDVPALRVDGGASANDWLMQFQADVLGCRSSGLTWSRRRRSAPRGSPGIALGVWAQHGRVPRGAAVPAVRAATGGCGAADCRGGLGAGGGRRHWPGRRARTRPVIRAVPLYW